MSADLPGILSGYLTRVHDASSRRDRDLRRNITSLLKELKALRQPITSADRFFLPFKQACESRSSKLIEVSLDCIQKLVAQRFLTGKLPLKPSQYDLQPNKSGAPTKLIDVIVKVVCECSFHSTDSVHLQVIKALLTIVTSTSCEVHEQSLMYAVRAIYHIYLSSRNLDNQTSAKAALTQMLNVVFQSMESATTQLAMTERKYREAHPEIDAPAVTANGGPHNGDEVKGGDAAEANGDAAHANVDRDVTDAESLSKTEKEVVDGLVEEVARDAVAVAGGEASEASSSSSPVAGTENGSTAAENGAEHRELETNAADASASENGAESTASPPEANGEHRDDAAAASGDAEDGESVSEHSKTVREETMSSQPETSKGGGGAPPPPVSAPAAAAAADNAPPRSGRSGSGPPQGNAPSASPASNSTSQAPQQQYPKGKFGWCIVCGKTANHFCIQTRDPVCGVACKVKNINRVIDSELERDPNSDVRVKMALAAHTIMLQNDAFLLFRALCKLSQKPLPTGANASDQPVALKSKILSLELLLSVMENAGYHFRTSKRFVNAVREFLIGCLLKNSISPIESIFGLSLSLFMTTIRNFKTHLKTEIGVFLDSVFLKIVESANSTFTQKMMVLKVFSKICDVPQALVDIFLNYDCGKDSINIFQHMTEVLEKITQSKFVAEDWITPVQEQALKLLALETLVTIMRSLLAWTQQATNMQQQAQTRAAQALLNGGHMNGDATHDDEMRSVPHHQRSASLSSTRSSGSVPPASAQGAHSPRSTAPASASAISEFSERFKQKQQLKKDMETGILKFNLKPSSGITYLTSAGFFEKTTDDIVKFIKSTPSLNKTQLGDYLGDPRNLQIFYAYVETLDFHGLEFDMALREFLTGFRIPGEAQKIDRMMEKFAQQYCLQNPSVFPTADVAYVLAYAIIMVNTDVHSPMVKRKMTKEDFIKNNTNISEEYRTPANLLGAIYDRILKDEIKIHGDSSKQDLYINPRQRYSLFQQESEDMVTTVSGYMKGVKERQEKESSRFYNATEDDIEAVRPMFDICWLAALATFSVLLEETEDPRVVELALNGYRYGIRIASIFDMQIASEAMVNSLANCTLLGTVNEMKPKNVEAIKMLLTIAHKEGDHLRKSWSRVLRCISDLELLQLIGSGSVPDSKHFKGNKYDRDLTSPIRVSHAMEAIGTDSTNVQTVATHIEPAFFDRIFSNSQNLNSDAIVFFVKHLCEVSAYELADPKGGRVFSLQKIVEITYYNMGRIRLVWSRIWAFLSAHFSHAGCHPNPNISMYAIDSLRQLACKFLEKDELSNFQFQTQFLKPFEIIMATNESYEIREFVIQSLSRVIQSRVDNVKSGWKSIFVVCTIAAADTHESLAQLTFELVEKVLEQYFPLIDITAKGLGMGTMDELINCFVAFGCNFYTDISLQSIDYLARCARHLVSFNEDGRLKAGIAATGDDAEEKRPDVENADSSSVPPSKEADLARVSITSLQRAPSYAGGEKDEADKETLPLDSPNMKAWFLCLTGLSRMVGDTRLEVRARALSVLFKVLREHGGGFSPAIWQLIFSGVLFPIFDDVRHVQVTDLHNSWRTRGTDAQTVTVSPASTRGGLDEAELGWLRTTSHAALSNMVELFAHFYEDVEFILPGLLGLLNSCISQESEELAKIGVKSLNHLLNNSGYRFTSESWTVVLESFDKVFADTLPYELLPPQAEPAETAAAEEDALLPTAEEKQSPAEASAAKESEPKADEAVGTDGASAPTSSQTSSEAQTASTSSPETLNTEGDDVAASTQPSSSSESSPSPQKAAQPSTSSPGPEQASLVSPKRSQQSSQTSPQKSPAAKTRDRTSSRESVRSTASRRLSTASTRSSALVASSSRQAAAPSTSTSSSSEGLPFKPMRVIAKSMVQHLLIDQILDIVTVFYGSLDLSHFECALRGLDRSAKFARRFNEDVPRRRYLWAAGFMKDRQKHLPELYRQEARARAAALQIMFRMYTNKPLTQHAKQQETAPVSSEMAAQLRRFAEPRLAQEARQVLFEYQVNDKNGKLAENRSKEMVACLVLRGILQTFSVEQFRAHLDEFYPLLCMLVQVSSADVRTLVAKILLHKVRPLLPSSSSQS